MFYTTIMSMSSQKEMQTNENENVVALTLDDYTVLVSDKSKKGKENVEILAKILSSLLFGRT